MSNSDENTTQREVAFFPDSVSISFLWEKPYATQAVTEHKRSRCTVLQTQI